MAGLMEGKCGLIVGGGSGIGRASAIRFAEEGARVTVAGRREDKLQETVRLITEAGGDADYVTCDITNEDDVRAMVQKVVDTYGRIDFAHNNSSRDQPEAPVWERDLETWKSVIDTNLTGTFLCIKHEGAVMVKQGFGAIVNTSSGAGAVGCAGQEPYAAAKAGVNNLTKSAAMGMGPYNVRVNAILPGVTRTPMIEEFAENFPEIYDTMMRAIPLGHAADPVDQANAAVFLCSDLASNITGVLLKDDGGYQAGYFTKKD